MDIAYKSCPSQVELSFAIVYGGVCFLVDRPEQCPPLSHSSILDVGASSVLEYLEAYRMVLTSHEQTERHFDT